jgi:hypothetical protein
MTDAAAISLPKVLVNLIGLNLPQVEALQLSTTEFIRVWVDDEAPVLLVWGTLTDDAAQAQALALWEQGIPAVVSEDPAAEEKLFRFLLQQHD